MGKQGPCRHCGVTSTPLWRNGPPEKPVLCNACGSRWRTKGTLVNYTPLHSRADGEEIEAADHRAQRMSYVMNKKIPKRKSSYEEDFSLKRSNLEFKKKAFLLDEEASNRSSSGSVVSNSESFDQPNAWETTFPCKKRTCVGRPKAASSVEKLTKDLYTILQEQQSSCLSGCSEEDLLFENEAPLLIGHGSVLMRDPHLVARDEESEASSLSVKTLADVAMLKEQRKGSDAYSVTTTSRFSNPNVSDNSSLVTIERHRESLNQRDVIKIGSNRIGTEESLEKSVSSFHTMSYDGGSMGLGYEDNEISDQDLLLDVPYNGSFPQAELLHLM